MALYHYRQLLVSADKGFVGEFSHGGTEPFYLRPTGNAKPDYVKDRVLCEVFAKRLAMVVQHWLLLTAGPLLGRSAARAAQRVRKQALRLVRALGVARRLVRALTALRQALQRGGRVKKRRGKPATFQVLENPQLHPFAHQKN